MKYQKEISLLQSKLRESMDQLTLIERSKAQMQDQLKQAFMRGLCAMNLEAMNVIKPNQPSQSVYDTGIDRLADNMSKNIAKIGDVIENSEPTPQKLDNFGDFHYQKKEFFKEENNREDFYRNEKDLELIQKYSEVSFGNEAQFTHKPENLRNKFTHSEINNDLLENPNKFSKEEVDEMFNSAIKNFGVGRKMEESTGVVILGDPLPESKEHMWRQAPIIGRNTEERRSTSFIEEEDEMKVGDIQINTQFMPSYLKHNQSKAIGKPNPTSKKDKKKFIREHAQNFITGMAKISEMGEDEHYQDRESEFMVSNQFRNLRGESEEGKVLRFEPQGAAKNKGMGFEDQGDGNKRKSERGVGSKKKRNVKSKIDTGLRQSKTFNAKGSKRGVRGDSNHKSGGRFL